MATGGAANSQKVLDPLHSLQASPPLPSRLQTLKGHPALGKQCVQGRECGGGCVGLTRIRVKAQGLASNLRRPR
eukprot:711136-Pelagomonas_calceolata.AAC.3